MTPLDFIPTRAHVDLFRLEKDQPVLAARVVLAAGNITVTGEAELVAELESGLFDALTGERLTVADGWSFAAALSSVYKNPYLYATDVISDE